MAKKLGLHQRVILNLPTQEFEEKLIYVNRTAKVVAGGRRFRFAALVAVGDKKGHLGVSSAKAAEVPDALKKATAKAKKQVFRVPIKKDTIPFDVEGNFCATKVILKPAPPGTGIIAASAVRTLVELAGIKNIRAKIIGSTNRHNVVKAVLDALLKLQDPEFLVGAARGLALQAVDYNPY